MRVIYKDIRRILLTDMMGKRILMYFTKIQIDPGRKEWDTKTNSKDKHW